MTSAALVLLIACANLAGALLARTLSRRKEFAVRLALGAGRGRLVRQLLTESMLLALAGGAAGVLLAWLVLSMLRGLARTALPDYADLSLDGGVVLVTAVLSLCTGLAFGLAPALSVDRSDPQVALRDEMRGASESRRSRRLRGVLVAGQIALCVSLLAGAGLLARSLWAMTTAPLGFDPDGVLTATVQMPPRDYPTPEARVRFLEQFADRLRTLPGVQAVADVSLIPTAVTSRTSFCIDGAPQRPNEAPPFVLCAMVSDDYFRTLRIPLRQGRTFDARDRLGAPPTVVISESMARRYWPQGDALGARIRIGPGCADAPLMEVVGIVGDVRNDRARPDAEPMLYRSSRQSPWPLRRLPAAHGRRSAGARQAHGARARGDRRRARAATRDDVAHGGRRGARGPTAPGAAHDVIRRAGPAAGLGWRVCDVRQHCRRTRAGVRRAHGARLASARDRGAGAAAGRRMDGVGLAGGAVGVVLVVRLLRDLLYEVSPFDPDCARRRRRDPHHAARRSRCSFLFAARRGSIPPRAADAIAGRRRRSGRRGSDTHQHRLP